MKKWVWVTIILLLLAGIAWAAVPAIRRKNNNGGDAGATGGTGSGAGGGSKAAALNETLLLKRGSTGAEVRELQKLLNSYQTANPLVVDGQFGPLTENKLYSASGNKLRSITLADARKLYTLTKTEGNLWSQLYGPNGTGGSTTDTSLSWWERLFLL